MRNLSKILFIILIILLIPIRAKCQIGQDKYDHAGAGIAISQTTFSLVNQKTNDYKLAWRVGVLSSFVAGYGKEMVDSFKTKPFSWSDAGFTFVSGLITSSINRGIQARTYRNKKVEYKEFEFNPPLVEK